MHIPGHLAIALAQHRLPSLSHVKALKPLLIASLFPDIVDKIIGYVLKAMPNGRHFAHNVFSLAGSSLIVALIWGRITGYAWFAGYLGHLLADSKSPVPWLFPAKHYPFKQGRLSFKLNSQFFRETLLLLTVLVIYRLSR